MAETEHVVLVTGAAGGIGFEMVRILLEDFGASVVATDLAEGGLATLLKQFPDRLRIIIGDIVHSETSEKCVKDAINQFGKLTGLCLMAAVFGPCYDMKDSSIEQWSKCFRINVLSHLHTLKYAVPELRKTKGRVTAATSGVGQGALFAGWGFYAMSKAAVALLITQLALEEPELTVIGVSPGLCDTKFIQDLLNGKSEGFDEEHVKTYKTFTAKVEMITPSVAAMAFVSTVLRAGQELSGVVLDYNDPRLPTPHHIKRKTVPGQIDYSAFVDNKTCSKQSQK